MKKLMVCIFSAVLLLTFFPTQSKAATMAETSTLPAAKTSSAEKSAALVTRLNEIKAIDKSSLNGTERKQLRKESRSIKRELKQISNGVYLSTGAVILLVVLLIILL